MRTRNGTGSEDEINVYGLCFIEGAPAESQTDRNDKGGSGRRKMILPFVGDHTSQVGQDVLGSGS